MILILRSPIDLISESFELLDSLGNVRDLNLTPETIKNIVIDAETLYVSIYKEYEI